MTSHEFCYFPFAGGRGEAIRCACLRGCCGRAPGGSIRTCGSASRARARAGHGRTGVKDCVSRRIAIHASQIECKHADLGFPDYQKKKEDTKDNAWLNGMLTQPNRSRRRHRSGCSAAASLQPFP